MPPALLIGHSLGGAAAIAAAARPVDGQGRSRHRRGLRCHPSAAPVRPRRRGEDRGARRGRGDAGGPRLRHPQKLFDDLRCHGQAARIAALRRPLLIMRSPFDQTVPIDAATGIFNAAKHPKSFVSLDHAVICCPSRPTPTTPPASSSVRARATCREAGVRSHGQDGDVVAEGPAPESSSGHPRRGDPLLADEPESVGRPGIRAYAVRPPRGRPATCTT